MTILLEQEEVTRMANKLGIAIVAVNPEELAMQVAA